MRLSRLLMATTALALVATPAHADPISLTILGATFTVNVAAIAVNIALGLVQSLLMKKKQPKSEEAGRKLNGVDASPFNRYAYGHLRLGGYVIGREIVGRNLYLGILHQHRPSAGPFTLQMDGRETPLRGDAYDFAGPGAESYDPAPEVEDEDHDLIAEHVRTWIGRGEQTTIPADILAACPALDAADRWPGHSVSWHIIRLGDAETAGDRWPNNIPNVTLTGRWSLLFDPRNPSHDPLNPATWEWSDNQALAKLDMAMHRDCLALPPTRIDMGSFRRGADICDEPIPLKAGGTEPRYRVAGVWEANGGTPVDYIQDVIRAGMSDLQEVTQGDRRRFVYIPGKFTPPIMTLRDSAVAEGDVEIASPEAGGVLNCAVVNFLAPQRNWEQTPLPEYVNAAALAEDSHGGFERKATLEEDLKWVPSAGQAARIAKRSVLLSRPERIITAPFLRAALFAHASAVIRLEAPTRPYLDGVFRVLSWGLALITEDEAAGTYRLQINLRLQEFGPEVDAWSPEEEPEVEAAPAQTAVKRVQPPRDLTVVSSLRDWAGETQLVMRVSALPPEEEAAVTGYLLRWRKASSGGGGLGFERVWEFETLIKADKKDADGRVFHLIESVHSGAEYEFEMRTMAGASASRVVTTAETPSPPDGGAPLPPKARGAEGTPAEPPDILSGIDTTWETPRDPEIRRLRLYRSDSADFAAAEALPDIPTALGERLTVPDSDMPPGATRWYWARCLDKWGRESALAGPQSATRPTP